MVLELELASVRACGEDHTIGKDLGPYSRDALKSASTVERERTDEVLGSNNITCICKESASCANCEETKVCSIKDSHFLVLP